MVIGEKGTGPSIDPAEALEILLRTWGLLSNPSRWARDLSLQGSDQVAVAWSLQTAILRETVRVASFPLTVSCAIEELVGELAYKHGYKDAIDLNESASHDEMLQVLEEAICGLGEAIDFELAVSGGNERRGNLPTKGFPGVIKTVPFPFRPRRDRWEN